MAAADVDVVAIPVAVAVTERIEALSRRARARTPAEWPAWARPATAVRAVRVYAVSRATRNRSFFALAEFVLYFRTIAFYEVVFSAAVFDALSPVWADERMIGVANTEFRVISVDRRHVILGAFRYASVTHNCQISFVAFAVSVP